MKKQILLITILSLFGFLSAHAAIGDKYEGEAFDQSEGARAESANVGYIKNGTWIMFNTVSFSGDEEWIEVAGATSTDGGNIEFRLDALDGTLIGTAEITSTGGWQTYEIFKADITATTGDHALYLVFTGGDGYLFNIDYFKLMATVPSYEVTTSVSPENAGMVVRDVPGMVSEGSDVKFYAQRLAGYKFSHWADADGNSLSTDNPYTVKITADYSISAVFETMNEEIQLPTWTFDTQYIVDSTGAVVQYIPTELEIINNRGFKGAEVFANNYPASGDAKMVMNSDTSFTSLTGENHICRLNWDDANTVDDFTDPSQHKQYFEFQIPTKGFKDISLEFSFSGGQSSIFDYLELVYSVDGTTWVDGGTFYSENHWNTWVTSSASLQNAENKNLVTVRLIGISDETGENLNFNLDYLLVGGTKMPSAISSTQLPVANVTSGNGVINVDVQETSQVSVYSLDGKVLFNKSVSGLVSIPSKSGVFIVKAGSSVCKVSVR